MNMNKICSKCGNEYPATTAAGYFHRNKSRPDGLADYCKPCAREASLTAKRKLAIDPNTGGVIKAGALSQRKRRATEEGLEKSRAATRKLRATEEGREANRESSRESQKKRYANGKIQAYLDNNPLYRLRQRMTTLICNSMKRRGWSKTTKTARLLGCDFDFLLSHLKSTLPDYEKHDVIHIDHIVPCNCAENEHELNALQHYSNLQWLPGPENLSKSDTLPPDWRERKAKLMEIYFERFPERREAA